MAKKINPYNFVPLRNGPDRSAGYSGRHRFKEGDYSGKLACVLEALSPLISLDQRCPQWIPVPDRRGQATATHIKLFRFLRNSRDEPILQGTSLKGMIRSVYEAITDSCLPLAATTGLSQCKGQPVKYRYQNLGPYDHSACNRIAELCPTCRLFGTIDGDVIHCQGQITFSDAYLMQPSKLIQDRCYLRELSGPKPHHTATYGDIGKKLDDPPIAGRKFYYHQGEKPVFTIEGHESNKRCYAINEYAPPKTKFSFRVLFENLSTEEISRLLLALELSQGLGHKLGVGKAIGMGSCRISIDWQQSSIMVQNDRYKDWNINASITDRTFLKADPDQLPPMLREVLRLNKAEEGDIGYPTFRDGYPQEPINARGEYERDLKALPGQEAQPERELQKVCSPVGEAPQAKPDELAVWLKAVYENNLVFVDTTGREYARKPGDFQGKRSLLEAGRWFLLRGEKAVFPVKK